MTTTTTTATLRRWGRRTAGLATAASAIYLFVEYRDLAKYRKHRLEQQLDQKQPRLLVIPFHRLELVQQQDRSIRAFLRSRIRRFLRDKGSSDDDDDDDDSNTTLSSRELVQLLHQAAQDNGICGLYGRFGVEGPRGNLQWADWEEVRNALTVFAQSHRRHYEPKAIDFPDAPSVDQVSSASMAPEMEQDDAQVRGDDAQVKGDEHQVKGDEDQVMGDSAEKQETKAKPADVVKPEEKEGEAKEEKAVKNEETTLKKDEIAVAADPAIGGEDSAAAPSQPLIRKKPMICYADSLGHETDRSGGNPFYYLATVFDEIQLQQQGELHLKGIYHQSIFVRDLMERNGVNVHVFRPSECDYKTAPDMFLDYGMTRAHKEHAFNLVDQLNQDLVRDMTAQKEKAEGGDDKIQTAEQRDETNLQKWQRIYDTGIYSAAAAVEAGLVNAVVPRDPLEKDWLSKDKDPELVQADEPATEAKGSVLSGPTLSFAKYRNRTKELERLSRKLERWTRWGEKWLGAGFTMSLFGRFDPTPEDVSAAQTSANKPKPERIAQLDVMGAIDGPKARKIVSQLRALRKQVANADEKKNPEEQGGKIKCLVMRVACPGGSVLACEQVFQELKALQTEQGIPYVVSMGNVATSGGYYISAPADRIFGLNKTLTGSIGVFGLRVDLTGLVHQYGAHFEHVATGPLAGSMTPFVPMNRATHDTMMRSVNRFYQHFLELVKEGRSLPVLDKNSGYYFDDDDSSWAQGKVWTGRQAMEVGLLDEIGGYERALAYARRTYCDRPEEAQLWDASEERRSGFGKLLGRLQKALGWKTAMEFVFEDEQAAELQFEDSDQAAADLLRELAQELLQKPNAAKPLAGLFMMSDEASALHALLRERKYK